MATPLTTDLGREPVLQQRVHGIGLRQLFWLCHRLPSRKRRLYPPRDGILDLAVGSQAVFRPEPEGFLVLSVGELGASSVTEACI